MPDSMLMEVVIDIAAGFYAIIDGFTSRHRDQETRPLRGEDEIILVAKDNPSDCHSPKGAPTSSQAPRRPTSMQELAGRGARFR